MLPPRPPRAPRRRFSRTCATSRNQCEARVPPETSWPHHRSLPSPCQSCRSSDKPAAVVTLRLDSATAELLLFACLNVHYSRLAATIQAARLLACCCLPDQGTRTTRIVMATVTPSRTLRDERRRRPAAGPETRSGWARTSTGTPGYTSRPHKVPSTALMGSSSAATARPGSCPDPCAQPPSRGPVQLLPYCASSCCALRPSCSTKSHRTIFL